MITTEEIEAARNAIGSVLHHHRACYTNGISLRRLYEEKQRELLFALSNHPAPEPLKITNCMIHMHQLAVSVRRQL